MTVRVRKLSPAGAVRAPGHYDEPGPYFGLFGDAQHEARGSLVERVGVFEHERDRAADRASRLARRTHASNRR